MVPSIDVHAGFTLSFYMRRVFFCVPSLGSFLLRGYLAATEACMTTEARTDFWTLYLHIGPRSEQT